MKKRTPPIALLYAAPNIAKPDPESEEAGPAGSAEPEYPNNLAEPEHPNDLAEPEYPDNYRRREPRTGRVYAGPQIPESSIKSVYAAPRPKPRNGLFSNLRSKLSDRGSRMECVYAGPELMAHLSGEDDAPDDGEPNITAVYSGPRPEPEDAPEGDAPEKAEPVAAGVYAGPNAFGPGIPVAQAGTMMVYAGPEWFAERAGQKKPDEADTLDVYAGPGFFGMGKEPEAPAENEPSNEPEDSSPIAMKDAMEAASQFPPGACGLVMAPLDITFGNSILKKPESADGNKKFCPECGSEVDPEHKFCTECGRKLK